MSDRKPLMPKATAVWLVANTSLTFEQIAAFCGLHVLEVKGIADGDVAQGIKGLDPVTSGQLTREEIEEAERDPARDLHLAEPKVIVPETASREGSALHARVAPPGPSQRRALAAAQPPGAEGQPDHAPRRHDQADDHADPRALALERAEPDAAGSRDARPLLADRPRRRGEEGGAPPRPQGQAGRREGRHAAADRGDDRSRQPSARSRSCSPRLEEAREETEQEEQARVFAKLKELSGGERSDEDDKG